MSTLHDLIRECYLCLDGCGMPHEGALKFVRRVLWEDGEEVIRSEALPCDCVCHYPQRAALAEAAQ